MTRFWQLLFSIHRRRVVRFLTSAFPVIFPVQLNHLYIFNYITKCGLDLNSCLDVSLTSIFKDLGAKMPRVYFFISIVLFYSFCEYENVYKTFGALEDDLSADFLFRVDEQFQIFKPCFRSFRLSISFVTFSCR